MLTPNKPGCRMGLLVIFGVRCPKPQKGQIVGVQHRLPQNCRPPRKPPEQVQEFHFSGLANAFQCLTLNGSAVICILGTAGVSGEKKDAVDAEMNRVTAKAH
ncbi:uncharacterized protein YALI1_C16969g [Yarrowia lipolytica]|uniref:Uncharacterized protein n=1 Tax=Yarrowia lipolytica TaxID=4952 RepID=A0A1D8NAS4_YARLL|nr:hypothetical protein YALI1_C16969g [Yarrowia lipolytica]